MRRRKLPGVQLGPERRVEHHLRGRERRLARAARARRRERDRPPARGHRLAVVHDVLLARELFLEAVPVGVEGRHEHERHRHVQAALFAVLEHD